MPTAKKRARIQATEIDVGKRTLESVLIDLAEQIKSNDARSAMRSAQAEERSAQAEERSARAEERSVRAEELATVALQTIAAVSQDLRALTQELRSYVARTDGRLDALERTASTQS